MTQHFTDLVGFNDDEPRQIGLTVLAIRRPRTNFERNHPVVLQWHLDDTERRLAISRAEAETAFRELADALDYDLEIRDDGD